MTSEDRLGEFRAIAIRPNDAIARAVLPVFQSKLKDEALMVRMGLATFAFALALSGCGFDVQAVSPQPNLSLPAKHPGFALQLKGIPDTYEVPAESGVMGGTVHGWQASLQAGFHNAFPAEPRDHQLVLILEHATFSVVPAAVNGAGGVVSGRGQIQFRGRWMSGSEDIPFSGTAESKTTTTNRGEASLLASSAIESMYEQIWAGLVKAASESQSQPSQSQ